MESADRRCRCICCCRCCSSFCARTWRCGRCCCSGRWRQIAHQSFRLRRRVNLAVAIPYFLPGVMAYVGFNRHKAVLPGWSFVLALAGDVGRRTCERLAAGLAAMSGAGADVAVVQAVAAECVDEDLLARCAVLVWDLSAASVFVAAGVLFLPGVVVAGAVRGAVWESGGVFGGGVSSDRAAGDEAGGEGCGGCGEAVQDACGGLRRAVRFANAHISESRYGAPGPCLRIEVGVAGSPAGRG